MKLFAAAALLALPVAAAGLEVAGVDVPETASPEGAPAPLVLNGAGVRSKFFVDVYVGALYLSTRATTTDAVLADPGPKRVRMHFVYDEVSDEKLRAAWSEGFEDNHDAAALGALADRIRDFNALFPTLGKGDVVDVDYLPATGTRVTINGALKGTVPGEDFHRAVLRIWLGDSPADRGLKRGMLGG